MDNTVVRHRVAHAIAHVLVEAAQEVRPAHDHRDLRAQALEQRSELDRDIAAADHEKATRKDGQIEDLIRGDRVLEPFDASRHYGARAGGDKDMASGDLAPVGKSHPVRVDDGRPLFDQFGAGPRQILAIGVGEPADLLLLGRNEGRPVERRLANAPAKPGGVAEVVGKAAGVNIELLRHAAADDARAADRPSSATSVFAP